MVDGQRLISTAGTYGAANSTYDSENASFGVYTAHGSTGGASGPLWFSVITKAGMYMEYGATADSRATIGNGDVCSWSLSKVMDPNGNYMTYEYENVGGEHQLRGGRGQLCWRLSWN